MDSVKVLLVDDHEIVRDGLRTLLNEQEEVRIVGEVCDGEEAVTFCRKQEVDLVIMDINMPVMDGIEATRQIREQSEKVRILALTMSDDDVHIRNMIQAGASGYILKSSGRMELQEAVELIMDGKHYFSDEATRRVMMELVRSRGDSGKRGPVRLTQREREVLSLIVEENTNQEIADILSVSVRTVDAHRRNLLQKTGARNTAGLVRFGLEQGIYRPGSNQT